MSHFLVITEDQALFQQLCESLPDDVLSKVEGFDLAREALQREHYDVCFVDSQTMAKRRKLEGSGFIGHFMQMRRLQAQLYIVVICPKRLEEGTKSTGPDDVLCLPLRKKELLAAVAHLKEDGITKKEPREEQFWHDDAHSLVQTQSPAMSSVFKAIQDVARTRSTVLLSGETGVGKSMVARLLHRHSKVKDGPFISLHCGAIAETLLESELFGHEKGAFTGAIKQKLGRFELARGGTLFLDEIGTISAAAQIKLLQVIQEGIFQRVGGEQDVHSNARLISATNEDLEVLCEQGKFRTDLYYRLNVFPIGIPPLRERRADIPSMVNAFIAGLNQSYDKNIEGMGAGVIEALQAYHWPGNIRQLENLVERAYILERSPHLCLESFPAALAGKTSAILPLHADLTLAKARDAVIDSFERQYLINQLELCRGRLKEVADAAGISVRQLHRLMSKYHLDKNTFKNL